MNKKLDHKRRTIALVVSCICLLAVLFVILLMRYQKKDDSVSDDTPYLSEIDDFTQYSEEEMKKIINHDTNTNLGCYYGNLSVSDREVFKEHFPYLIKKDGVTTYTKDKDGNIITTTQSELDFAIQSYQDDLALYGEEALEKCKQIYAEEHPDEEIPMYFPVTQLSAAVGEEQTLLSETCEFYVNFLLFGNDSKTTNRISTNQMQNVMRAPDGTELNKSYFVSDNYDEFISWGDSENKNNASKIAAVYNNHKDGAVKITAKVDGKTLVGKKTTLSGPIKVKSISVENKSSNIRVVIDGWRDYLAIPSSLSYSKNDHPALGYYADGNWHRSILIFDMSYQVPTNALPTRKQNVNKHQNGRLLAATYMYPDGGRTEKDNNKKYDENTSIEYFMGESMGTIGFFNSCQPAGIKSDITGNPLTSELPLS